MQDMSLEKPDRSIGVAVVTFNAADVISGCLDSLIELHGCRARVLVVDNASSDGTVAVVRDWGAGRLDADGAPLLGEEEPGGPRSGAQVVLLHSGSIGALQAGSIWGWRGWQRKPRSRISGY